jgi:transcriptional regulator with XRE-family HTH domain
MQVLVLNSDLMSRARLASGLTVQDLAERTGLCKSTVIKGLGGRSVSLRSCRLLCEALGLQIGECLVDERTGRPWREGGRW